MAYLLLLTSSGFFFKVGNLLGKHADLMEGFDEFLVQCEKNGNVQVQNKFSLSTKSSFSFYSF